MAKIYASIGNSGEGKTLMLARFANYFWFKGRRIYANFDLDFEEPRTPLKQRIEEERLNYTPIFTPNDLYNVTEGSAIFISEIDTFGADEDFMGGVDSYNYKSPAAVRAEKFFKKRLRKMHCFLMYDVQQLIMAPKRIRDETVWVYEPYIHKEALWYDSIKEKWVTVPYIVHYKVRKLDKEDGKHKYTGDIKILTHPVFGIRSNPHPKYGVIRHITPDMLTCYDTDGDAFQNENNPFRRVENQAGEEPSFENEQKIMQRLKLRLPQASVTPIPNSGLGSKKYGDLELELPLEYKLPKFIIEVKGISKVKGDRVVSLNARTKDGLITNWAGGVAFDKEYGSKHLLSWYDPYKNRIFVTGIQENFGYLGKRSEPHVTQLKGIMELGAFVRAIRKRRKAPEFSEVLKTINVPEPRGDMELDELDEAG